MTMVLNQEPDTVNIYNHTKNEASMLAHSKLSPEQIDRQTNGQKHRKSDIHIHQENITHPHTRVVTMFGSLNSWEHWCNVMDSFELQIAIQGHALKISSVVAD